MRFVHFIGITICLLFFSCQREKNHWKGIWHTSVEYIPNVESVLEFELRKNLISNEYHGRWETLDLFASGEISKVDIDGVNIHFDLGNGGLFQGKFSAENDSLSGVLYGFSPEGNDTVHFVKVDEWTSRKPALINSQGNVTTKWSYNIPKEMNDGWSVKDLGSGEGTEIISEMFQQVVEERYRGLDAVLISHKGRLVVEEYFYLGEIDKLHTIQSCTKSITSLLIGIAMDQGLIENLSQPVQNFFPGYIDTLATTIWPISIEDALTMSAKLDWKEWEVPYGPKSDLFLMNNSSNMYSYVLNKKPDSQNTFKYNTGLTVLLGGIIENVSGVSVETFAETNLFRDLGIKNYGWYQLNGIVHTGGGLWLRPRDFLKLGQLVLNGGQWQGKQLISKSWINESTSFKLPARESIGYGFQWWTDYISSEHKSYSLVWAEGLGGQFLFLLPDLELAVLFLHHNPNDLDLDHTMAWKELSKYIIPTFSVN